MSPMRAWIGVTEVIWHYHVTSGQELSLRLIGMRTLISAPVPAPRPGIALQCPSGPAPPI
jgi:hypothetical protein